MPRGSRHGPATHPKARVPCLGHARRITRHASREQAYVVRVLLELSQAERRAAEFDVREWRSVLPDPTSPDTTSLPL
jgi:hypothetical protein